MSVLACDMRCNHILSICLHIWIIQTRFQCLPGQVHIFLPSSSLTNIHMLIFTTNNMNRRRGERSLLWLTYGNVWCAALRWTCDGKRSIQPHTFPLCSVFMLSWTNHILTPVLYITHRHEIDIYPVISCGKENNFTIMYIELYEILWLYLYPDVCLSFY